MSNVIRKQVYIHRGQADLLLRLAEERGVSVSEVVRQAIEHEATRSPDIRSEHSRQAWLALVNCAMSRRGADLSEPAYQWQRDDAYEQEDL